jgi:hypothetical protein
MICAGASGKDTCQVNTTDILFKKLPHLEQELWLKQINHKNIHENEKEIKKLVFHFKYSRLVNLYQLFNLLIEFSTFWVPFGTMQIYNFNFVYFV